MKKKNSVNHARAKRRIKTLKLKNFFNRVIEKRSQKLTKLKKKKGITVIGRARDHAEYIRDYQSYSRLKGTKNQRQKRKIWRHAPHMRKKAA